MWQLVELRFTCTIDREDGLKLAFTEQYDADTHLAAAGDLYF